MSYTTIGFNYTASMANHFVARASRENKHHMLALSSGKRINSFADDASGYFLARGLESSRRGLNQAITNIETAKNVLDIAAASYGAINELIMKMKEKVVAAADDAYTTDQRNALQGMVTAMVAEIDDAVKEGTFQGKVLIDGSFTNKSFQSGAEAGDVFKVSLAQANAATLGLTGLDISTSSAATAAMATVDNALSTLQRAMQRAGEYTLRLEAKSDALRVTMNNTEAARSGIEDADFAVTKMRQSKVALLQEMGFTSLKNAIAAPQQVLSLFV